MNLRKLYLGVVVTCFLFSFSLGYAHQQEAKQEHQQEEVNISEVIFEHISDSYDFHILDWKGHPVSLSLPIILWTENGLVTFMSGAFHHDNQAKYVVEKQGVRLVRYKEQIYYARADKPYIDIDPASGKVLNERPLDFSITKNVFTMFLAVLILLGVFIPMARGYRSRNMKAPKGVVGILETIVVFIRDDIAIPNIGKEKYKRYMPYLLTIFFLIWFLNLFGLIPFFPFAGTLSNDILFVGVLACATFIITLFSANKNYWRHIFATPGVPAWLLPIMIPVEIMGMFTKPFALMIRLFANITAGHIVVLSLLSVTFFLKTIAVAPVSVLFTLFISVLELFVAILQAYVFTLLSALYIGQAVEDDHH